MRGSIPSHTRRWLLIALIAGLALVGGIALAALPITDSGSYDFTDEVFDRTDFDQEILPNAVVQYIGDENTTFGPTGSGVFDAFVRLQADETERGYNTDFKFPEFDTKKGGFTRSILLSEIPTVDFNGEAYWEFFADINDSDNTPFISLNEFELWLTGDPELIGYDFAGTDAVQLYDFSGEFLINDVNQGSGRGDLRYLVRQGDYDLGNCNYGNPACTTNLVLYSEWGTSGELFWSDGGFEEWKVKRYPILQVTKDVFGSFETNIDWTITKSVTPETWDLFTGESGTSKYTVTVDKTASEPLNTLVYGTITIVGDDKDDVDATITDYFAGMEATITGCSVPQNVDGTYTIDSKSSVTCGYTLSPNAPIAGDNVATATTVFDGVTLLYSGSATLELGDYTEILTGEPPAINVDDTNGLTWAADDDAVWMYERTFSCDGDEGSHPNKASIRETDDAASANVTVNCYGLTVDKTVFTEYTRAFDWTIDKNADATYIELLYGEVATITYNVVVDLADPPYVDSGWRAFGDITVGNGHPDRVAELTGVSDLISPDIAAAVTCPSLTVPAGESITCSYTADLPDASTRTNTASATQQLYDFASDGTATPAGTIDYLSDAETVAFGDPTYLIDEAVDVTDSFAGFLGTLTYTDTLPKTFTYTRTVDSIALECGLHRIDNTATFVEWDTGDTGSADWTVWIEVICGDSRLTPTNTECEQFAWDRDNPWYNLDALLYSGDTTVTNVVPGAMFYWIEVNHGGGDLTVDFMQNTDFSREISALDVKFYDSGCSRILDVGFMLNGGDGYLTTNVDAGTYYMQVRYDPKSLIGAAIDPGQESYTFSFNATINGLGGVLGDSLSLDPK